MYLLMEWEGYTGKYLVQGNNIWTEHSKVCVLWTRNKNFSLFFFFSQGRTRNSKLLKNVTFLLISFFSFMFLQQICVSAGPDGFFWIGSCQLVQPYMSVFSMVFWMALWGEGFEFVFINYHGIMKFKREISKFSYYNDLNLLIIRMRLFHFKPSVTS